MLFCAFTFVCILFQFYICLKSGKCFLVGIDINLLIFTYKHNFWRTWRRKKKRKRMSDFNGCMMHFYFVWCFVIFFLHVVVVHIMPFQTKSDQIAKLRGTADQMRHHLKVDRMVMSKTIAEIIGYCNHMAAEDPLLNPVKDNPFKDKKSCAILWCDQGSFSLAIYTHVCDKVYWKGVQFIPRYYLWFNKTLMNKLKSTKKLKPTLCW